MTQKSFASNDKTIFQSIEVSKRSAYRKKILEIQQIKGQQPVFYEKEYPQTGSFTYKDFKLHYGCIQQTTTPQALIFFHHGMYCYGGTSGYLAHVITDHAKKVNVYALDFKNAGLSEGDCPGHYTVEELEEQALLFITFIEEKFKSNKSKPKMFVMGQSMGGLVSFKLSVKHPERFSGAVMFAPALRDCKQNIPVLKQLGRMMGYLCPTFKIIPQDFIGFTRYENFEHMKAEKGRYTGSHPPGTAYSILKQMDTCQKLFGQMSVPYLCIQGGVDKSVDMFAPLDLEKESPSQDKTTIYFRDVWHDILVDQEIKDIAVIVAKWIKQRI